jgi:hypothetical protein
MIKTVFGISYGYSEYLCGVRGFNIRYSYCLIQEMH